MTVTRAAISRMTDAELEELIERVEDLDEASDAELQAAQWAEQEQDARALATSDDDRVRESVGVYRSAR